MKNSLILAGYSGSFLELLSNSINLDKNEIIVLEDNKKKYSFIEKFDNKSIKKITFKKGADLISRKDLVRDVYISVSSTPSKRYQTYIKLNNELNNYPNLFQASSKISNFCELSNGIYLGDYTTVESNTFLKNFCFINSHTHIGHDSGIGNFSILGGSVTVNGNCDIGDFCLLGSAVTVINNKKIGWGSVIQAGTTITENIPPLSYVSGNPIKILPVQILGSNFCLPENVDLI